MWFCQGLHSPPFIFSLKNLAQLKKEADLLNHDEYRTWLATVGTMFIEINEP